MAGRAGKPVMRVSAFWDSSALVPLCVRQAITPRVIALYKSHDMVVWWATPVEIASALARLARIRQLDSGECDKAHELAKSLADSWSVVQPSDALRSQAAQLAGRHDLRAADSLQLAAALEWCEGAPQGRVFLTADHKLREAALLSGFDAKQI
jgi:predicted nucleic acid-binding protein